MSLFSSYLPFLFLNFIINACETVYLTTEDINDIEDCSSLCSLGSASLKQSGVLNMNEETGRSMPAEPKKKALTNLENL